MVTSLAEPKIMNGSVCVGVFKSFKRQEEEQFSSFDNQALFAGYVKPYTVACLSSNISLLINDSSNLAGDEDSLGFCLSTKALRKVLRYQHIFNFSVTSVRFLVKTIKCQEPY